MEDDTISEEQWKSLEQLLFSGKTKKKKEKAVPELCRRVLSESYTAEQMRMIQMCIRSLQISARDLDLIVSPGISNKKMYDKICFAAVELAAEKGV